ncbi:YciI family protein [Streptomyces sp. NBC_01198]|uniref:YciI family protein n=1 Tax=Streptomyces sp. NBC_01198 TaxID=2903769 RepID=UPI002E138BA5|nr:YciI family protein [Streptomyces sp. NBC_01198]
MFLILFDYQVPLERIDELKDRHYTNPEGVFARGLVRLAGRRVPRTGGLVIAEGDRATVEAAVASDPFVTSGAATVEIIEFEPTWPLSDPSGQQGL